MGFGKVGTKLVLFSFLILICIVEVPSAYSVGYLFSTPVNISNTSDSSLDSHIASSGNNVYIVWHDVVGGNDVILFKKSTDNGATFGSTITLSNSADISQLPRIAASGTNVYIVWEDDSVGGGDIMFAKSTDSGSTFGAPVNLSNNAGLSSIPQVTLSGTNVYVTWVDSTVNSNGSILFSASINGGAFSAPQTLSSNLDTSVQPRIAASGTNVYVVWEDDSLGTNDILYSRSTDSGSTFGAPVNLSNNAGGSLSPEIVASGSSVYVVWNDFTINASGGIMFVASTDSGSTFGSIISLDNGSDASQLAQLAASGTNVYIVWEDDSVGGGDIMFAKSTDSGSTFGVHVNLSSNSGASLTPQISVSSNNVQVVWQDQTVNANGNILFVGSDDSGATFGSQVTLSSSSDTSDTPVVLASNTMAYVTWNDLTSLATNTDIFFATGTTTSVSVQFDSSQYKQSDTATITIISHGSNLNPALAETISANVKSTSDPTGITLTLTETGPNTGIFSGQVSFTTGASSGNTLKTVPGDTITATFSSQTGTANIFPRIVAFHSSPYSLNDLASVTVTDQNSNTNPLVAETIPIQITSTTDPTGITLTLTETGPNTGTFTSSNIIFTTGTGQFKIGDTATIKQTETNFGFTTNNAVDTISVTATSSFGSLPITLTETGPNTGVFEGKLSFTSSASSGNSLQVQNGDIVGVTYLGETSQSLIIPNPNAGVGSIPAAIGDTVTATYMGSTGTVPIVHGPGGGGGGGGLLRPGLVLDVISGVVGGGAPSQPPVFFDSSSIPINSLPDAVKKSILNPDPTKPIPPIENSNLDFPLEIDNKGFYLPLHANTISTVTETVGKPFHLKLEMIDPYNVIHVSLFTNLKGQTSAISDSDTAIIYDQGKPLNILDPHHLFSNVTIAASKNGAKFTFDYSITFAKPMQRSDIYLRSWNELLGSTDMDILDALQVNGTQASLVQNLTSNVAQISNKTIQNTIQNTTIQNTTAATQPDAMTAIKEWGGYAPNPISDKELLSTFGIQGQQIPSWLMKTTKWLVNGQMSEDEFINIIKYLAKNGMIK